MESGSTLRKLVEPKASESEQKWKEAGERLKEKPVSFFLLKILLKK